MGLLSVPTDNVTLRKNYKRGCMEGGRKKMCSRDGAWGAVGQLRNP